MKNRRKHSGFTLIEILAATGIMTVVILVVLGLTTNVLSIWNRSSGRLTSNYEARVALDLLTRDLESLVIRNKQFNWLEVRWEPVNIGTGNINFTGAIPNMPQLYFMSPVVDRPLIDSAGDPLDGDVCAVAYQLAYENPFTGDQTEVPAPMFALYRFVIDSENTFEFVMSGASFDPSAPSTHLSSKMAGSPFIDEDGGLGSASSSVATFYTNTVLEAENFLSANVVDFRIALGISVPDATGGRTIQRIDPYELGYTQGLSYQFFLANQVFDNAATPTAGASLEYIDVSLSVMSEEGLDIMRQGSIDTSNWHELVAQYSQTYSRRIQIMSDPL